MVNNRYLSNHKLKACGAVNKTIISKYRIDMRRIRSAMTFFDGYFSEIVKFATLKLYTIVQNTLMANTLVKMFFSTDFILFQTCRIGTLAANEVHFGGHQWLRFE